MKLLEKPKFTTAHSRAGTKRALLGCAGHLLGGFVLSAGAVAGGCSPFAVALVAVSGRRDFLFSALGAGLGYMIFGTGTARVRYFAAVLIALVGALAMAAFLPRRDARLPMALSCLAVGMTGAVLQLRLGGGAADYALVLGESILAGGGGYFFFRAEHCNYRRLRCKAAPTGDLVCVLISGSLLLMSLSRLTIFGIAPARIAAVLLILITLRFGSSRLGVTLALCLGFALGLAGQDTMFLLGAYGFSALLAALFDRLQVRYTTQLPKDPITSYDLYAAGLAGTPDSKQKKKKLLAALDLPEFLSTSALLAYLNSRMQRDEFLTYVDTI